MDLTEIENALKKSSDGDFSVRIGETTDDPRLKPVIQMLNRTLEKAAEVKELKHRADLMIHYNPMAIAIVRNAVNRIYRAHGPSKNTAVYREVHL